MAAEECASVHENRVNRRQRKAFYRNKRGQSMTMSKRVCIALSLLFFMHSTLAERVEITLSNGTTLGVYLLLPAEPANTELPLLVLMPGGSGEEALARDLQNWLGQEFIQRGYAVAIPVSPNQRSFRGDNNALIPLLIEELHKSPQIKSSKTLLSGISNGGMSALEIAAAMPTHYSGIVAVPALVPPGLKVNALEGMPIYLRIGDQDEMSWMTRLDETASKLREGGAIVDADLVFMSLHMFQMEWNTLDPWLEALQSKQD